MGAPRLGMRAAERTRWTNPIAVPAAMAAHSTAPAPIGQAAEEPETAPTRSDPTREISALAVTDRTPVHSTGPAVVPRECHKATSVDHVPSATRLQAGSAPVASQAAASVAAVGCRVAEGSAVVAASVPAVAAVDSAGVV